jgi:D-glycero-alpha-D-manno-heptose-7-phosphate kinase
VELELTGITRTALAVPVRELERRLVLAYPGASRNSGINNWDVMSRRIANDPVVVAAFDGIRDAALALRAALESGDWPEVARQLGCEWEHRKRLGPTVTTPRIDDLFARARAAGALAGKVCGAGGGGCLFCLVEPDARAAVAAALATAGATVLPFSIDANGLQVVER